MRNRPSMLGFTMQHAGLLRRSWMRRELQALGIWTCKHIQTLSSGKIGRSMSGVIVRTCA